MVGPCAHGVTAIFAGCVLPQFPVIIIIWKLHRISNILIQHKFISTHWNTNVYDPANGLPIEATKDLMAGDPIQLGLVK